MAAERYDAEALAVWPRFLLTHAGLGVALGGMFTAALLALDARGIASLIFASEAPATPIAALALSCAALAACGSLATAMLQFNAYPGPEPARAAQAARRKRPRT